MADAMERWKPSKNFFRILFILFLPFFAFSAYNVVQQIRRLDELEKLIPERIEKHKTWTAARRAEVKAIVENAAKANEDDRDRLVEEAKDAQQALDDAIRADRNEILELWNEARNSRRTLPKPVFAD